MTSVTSRQQPQASPRTRKGRLHPLAGPPFKQVGLPGVLQWMNYEMLLPAVSAGRSIVKVLYWD